MKDMYIYEVTFKNGVVRYYGFNQECKNGEMVVAATSHGPLLGRITDVLDELPDGYDADKLHFILCQVPEENELTEQHRKAQIELRMKELDCQMKEVMEQKKETVMRAVFAMSLPNSWRNSTIWKPS